MTNILFDESHEELLHSELSELERVITEELQCVVLPSVKQETGLLADRIFDTSAQADVLVLAAPNIPFSADEVETIIRFVQMGKSLFIANNYFSLRESRETVNAILKPFGLQSQQLVSYPYETISNIYPHFLSSGVRRLGIKDPSYLKLLNDNPKITATLPNGKPFLSAVDSHQFGRIIAISDSSILDNSFINRDNNKQLLINIFRWLTYKNIIDIDRANIKPEIIYGQSEVFHLSLTNSCFQKNIEGINFLLESDDLAIIEKPNLEVHSLLEGESAQVKWMIQPRQIGNQSLRLKVIFPNNCNNLNCLPLIFEPIAQFNCIPDAEFFLMIRDTKGKELEVVETTTPFNVNAVVRWGNNAKQIPLNFALECPLAPISIEQNEVDRWQLKALNTGNWKIQLTIQETGQKIFKTITVNASSQFAIAKLERDIVSPLASKVHHLISQMWSEFDTDSLQKIPFQVLTPEDFVNKVYPSQVQERLLEALQAARSEKEEFTPLIDEILSYIAPIYSPLQGCCIPYDPKLSALLIEKYPSRETNIAYNFLCVEGHDLYSQTWLEGNIVALLLHEKYGHGFFYTQTKLGQQLSILYRHGLVRKMDAEKLKSPVLRSIYEEYGQVIQMLNHSALLLNEGFATWVELTGLQRLSGIFEQTVHRRKEFLFQDTYLRDIVIPHSEYLTRFNPGPGSKYQIMYDRLKGIQSFFSDIDSELGLQCAMQAALKATDIDFGIIEQDGQVQIRLSADQIKQLLLDNRKSFEAGSDLRMRRIWRVLKDFCDRFPNTQAKFQWQHEYLHARYSMVNSIIEKELGW